MSGIMDEYKPTVVVVTPNGTAYFFYDGAEWDTDDDDFKGFLIVRRNGGMIAIFAPGKWACAMNGKEYGNTNWSGALR